MINALMTDIIAESARRLADAAPADIDAVRNAPPLIGFGRELEAEQHELKQFLRKHLYHHYRVARMSNKARRIIRELFEAFMDDVRLLPPQFQHKASDDTPRAIADYIAGMTDRYAIREHRRIFAVEES